MSDIHFTQQYPFASMDDFKVMRNLGRRGGGHQLPELHVDAGAINVVQRGYSRLRGGRRPKRNARLALRMIEAAQSSCTLRYQRIGTYEGFTTSIDGPGSLDVGHYSAGTNIGDGVSWNLNYYPVHLFDLTSVSAWTPSGTPTSFQSTDVYPGRQIRAPCQYRLVSFNTTSGPSGYTYSNGDFFFVPQNGQHAGGGADVPLEHWKVERNMNSQYVSSIDSVHNPLTGNNVIKNASNVLNPMFSGKAYNDWADIRMTLYGARAQTTRFTVSLVQINDRVFDVRQLPPVTVTASGVVYNPNVNYYDGQRDRSQQDNMNVIVQEMTHPLVFHPLSSYGSTKQRMFKVLKQKSFVIGPDTDVNTDDSQPNMLVKFFNRLNRIVNYGWDDTSNKVNGDTSLDAPEFNQFFGAQTKAYAHPKAKLYLMVTAQAYTKVAVGSGGVPGNTDTTPSMDIIIRKKITYDSTPRGSGQNPGI